MTKAKVVEISMQQLELLSTIVGRFPPAPLFWSPLKLSKPYRTKLIDVSGEQQQNENQMTTITNAEMACSLFLDGLRAVHVVCELEVPGPVMAGRLAMASASTLLALSVVFAKYSNQNLQDIARRKNMLEMCIQGIDMLIDCKAVYASPRRCKALLDAAIAAAKRTSALSAEEMIAQANMTTTTRPTKSSPAVEVGNAKEKRGG